MSSFCEYDKHEKKRDTAGSRRKKKKKTVSLERKWGF